MKFYAIAIAALTLAAFTGCADKSAGVRVLTPFGTIDTSGTTELDLRGIMQRDSYPPPTSYNLDLQPLEK